MSVKIGLAVSSYVSFVAIAVWPRAIPPSLQGKFFLNSTSKLFSFNNFIRLFAMNLLQKTPPLRAVVLIFVLSLAFMEVVSRAWAMVL